VRPVDTGARLGGDEFAVLLDDLKDPADAVHAAERIQGSLAAPFDLNGQQFLTSVSIGVAYSMGRDRCPAAAAGAAAPAEVKLPGDILRDADTAMYRAKANGKARYEIFDAEMHEEAVRTLKLEADLRAAIERKQIAVHYQPIYSLGDDSLAGFEALARWTHPELGAVPPSKFIPLAEETGLIVSLGELVLRESCRQLAAWRSAFPAADGRLTVSVNLSGKQFAQADLAEVVEGILKENGLAPRHLRLEITESVIMERTGRSADALGRLSALGVQLSIDDFGTGYSSLSYLHRFPFNVLKVDRSFVSRMTSDPESEGIVETILTLASKLGKEVVAEGIETGAQLSRLRALGCGYGQGYLLCVPVGAERATEILARGHEAAVVHGAGGPGLPGGAPDAVVNDFSM
jgi:predicted signal transduction protein with EAL and GGDEF domain